MNEPTPNIPLLRKAVEWVEAEAAKPLMDRQWYQGAWVYPEPEVWDEQSQQYVERSCGTAFCVAGYIGQMLEPAFAKSGWVGNLHVSNFAQEALGLTDRQADALFRGSNTAEDVRRIAEEIAGEEL